MEAISNRHEGTAGGMLSTFSETQKVRVTVEIAPGTAELPTVQHTAWMLMNLLTRQEGVVEAVGFICPAGLPQTGRIVPFGSQGTDFGDAVVNATRALSDVWVLPSERVGRTFLVGPGGREEDVVHVYGEGWWGGCSPQPISSEGPTNMVIGSYIAACLAAGDVFCDARLLPSLYVARGSTFLSSWTHNVTHTPERSGPLILGGVELDCLLAGVGAVGSAWCHTLWASSGIGGRVTLVDNDEEGVTGTNLNRYCLFGSEAVGLAKASTAAKLMNDCGIVWLPHDGGLEEIAEFPPTIVSAVDVNTSRQAIQVRYPARILSAATSDLRAEMIRCGPPGLGACLRCYNPPEKMAPDEELRARVVENPELAEEIAADQGVSVGELMEWARTGKCGTTGERALSWLRRSEETETRFAVGFVSVLAGVMLAAETIKDRLGSIAPLSDSTQRAVFQFVNPHARTNRASSYNRDPNCPMCEPGVPATNISSERFMRLLPSRSF